MSTAPTPLVRLRRLLGSLRRSSASRAAVEPLHCLRRRLAQRIGRHHVLGFWRTTKGYLRSTSADAASHRAFDPAGAVSVPGAVFIGGSSHGNMPAQTVRWPETFVARIPKATVVGHKGAVLANDRRMLWDLSYDWPGLPHRHYLYDWRPEPAEIREFPGTTITLATMGAEVNYYHFLLNALPRIDVLRRADAFAAADRILVSGAVRPWQVEAMKLLGVPTDRLVGTAEHPVSRCETLIAPSLVLDPLLPPPGPVEWLRKELLPQIQASGASRRIFIDRSDATCRRVRNIEELKPFLSANGIECIQLRGKSLVEQVAMFHHADLVISNHGAALTNIIFCKPGARIIQLIPDDMQEHNFRPLAHYCGLRMEYLICPIAPGCEHIHIKDKDLLLAPELLARVL